MYDEGQNEKVLLSTYERGLKIPTTADYKKMADGFILDVLLANWDVYRNDNCLVDAAGNIHRIDNGGVTYALYFITGGSRDARILFGVLFPLDI